MDELNWGYVFFMAVAVVAALVLTWAMGRVFKKREPASTDVLNRALKWRQGRDTGASSIALWGVMLDTESDGSIPLDADDFGRCERLLIEIPEWREHLHELSDKFPQWAGIVREWGLLSMLYKNWREARFDTPESATTWVEFQKVIRPLIDEGRKTRDSMRRHPHARAFTVVELLVVVAILGILAVMAGGVITRVVGCNKAPVSGYVERR